MNLFQELRQRRIPQITSGYAVGGWGLIQFLEFLEGRMTISPNLVNLVALSLLLLLPTVVTLAWVHGRPGQDSWGRIPKVLLPANLLAIAFLLLFLFQGRELGAVTQTIAVQDEHGAVSERVVPKNEFRRRVLIFYPENTGSPDDDWARETLTFLNVFDAIQDAFIDAISPLNMINALQEAGSDDGHDLTPSLQRKIANDAHIPYFVTGSVCRRDDVWTYTTELHESKSGKEMATRSFESADIFALADLASRQLREDLGIPSAHLEESQDLPVSELMSSDLEAVKNLVKGVVAINHHNDWTGAVPFVEDAVERDPRFALAQFILFVIHQTLGQPEKASTAITAAMEDLYRLPERMSFMIKTQYYFSEKQDADKAMAVLQMWSQIYPNDVDAYAQQALFYYIRQDLPNVISAYERILEIDPSQVQYLEDIADLHLQLGHHDEAERHLQLYIESFPTRADGFKNLADFYSEIGRLNAARASLEKAQLIDPEDLDLALGLINLDIKSGRYAESRRALASKLGSAKTARDSFKIYSRQSNLAELTGQADVLIEALDSYHEAMLEFRSPLQADLIYSARLPAICRVGRPLEAIRRLDDLALGITQPYDKLTGVGKAWALANLGRPEEAKIALAEAEEIIDTFKFETYRSFTAAVGGLIAEADGDIDTAVTQYRLAIETAMQTAPLNQVRLARALHRQGHHDEALEVLTTALKLRPAHPQIHLEMAVIMHEQGESDQAREHLRTAQAAWTDADPDFPPGRKARELAGVIE